MTQPLLVVFDNQFQMHDFKRFFPEVTGDFCVYGTALTGHRYQRIVAFRPVKNGCSQLEFDMKMRELEEHIPCRLAHGGEFSIM